MDSYTITVQTSRRRQGAAQSSGRLNRILHAQFLSLRSALASTARCGDRVALRRSRQQYCTVLACLPSSSDPHGSQIILLHLPPV